MNIAPVEIYPLGKYTIRVLPRPDNPYWAVYIVILRDREIGRGFSRPGIGDCEFMESQRGERIVYAEHSAGLPKTYTVSPRGRPRKTLTQGRHLEPELTE